MKFFPPRFPFPFAAILLGFLVIGLFSVTPLKAQTSSLQPSGSISISEDPKKDLKNSLSNLEVLAKKEVDRLEKERSLLKELYGDGLIARVELEKSEQALADARAKVEDVARQISIANEPQPMPFGGDPISGLVGSSINWTTGNGRIDGLIRHYGKQHGVDPYLIYCLMSQESRFQTNAISHKGAQGLMQLMPGTAARYGVTNPYDIAQNISGGTRYLKDLLKMFNGRVDLALAGYNAGEGAVMKYGFTIPPYSETRNYVRLILLRYNKKPVS